jgi:hypothetical protein
MFTGDFRSVSGELIVKSGQTFTDDILLSIRSPVDFQDYLPLVSLSNCLDGDRLLADLAAFVTSDSALIEFSKRHVSFDEFNLCVQRVETMDSILLQLTVLKAQLPRVYEQALFCAWLGVVLMKHFKRSSSDVFHIFLLALVHDIGLLYVPMEFVKSRKKFNYKQLRVLQLHTVAGFEILKRITNIPEDILRAVAEHHENLDGTGYPVGKVGNTISRFSQCLNFLDAINALYYKRAKPGQRPFRDLIPMIQMNGHSRFGVLGRKLIEWLKEMPEPQVRAVPNIMMPFLIKAVKDRNSYISSCVDLMKQLSIDVGFRHGDQRVFALQNAIIHINISITQSGIINEAYMRWLVQVEEEGLIHAYREIEDVFLMMQEVIYHIGKLQAQIEFFLAMPCDSEEAYLLKKGLERFERVTLPKIPPSLELFWIANAH